MGSSFIWPEPWKTRINVNVLLDYFDPSLSFHLGRWRTQNRVKTHNMTRTMCVCVCTHAGARMPMSTHKHCIKFTNPTSSDRNRSRIKDIINLLLNTDRPECQSIECNSCSRSDYKLYRMWSWLYTFTFTSSSSIIFQLEIHPLSSMDTIILAD